MRTCLDGVIGPHILRNHEQFELLQRFARGIGVRQRHRRIGAHHPQRLDLAATDRLEHLDCLEPLMGRDARRLPEPAHAVDVRRRETHMRRELVGESADLAAAHGVGLAGQRERRGAHLADPCRGEMAVENGVDLVGALRRLVDALRIKRDHPRRVTEHRKERRHLCFRKTGRERRGSCASRHAPGPRQRLVEACGVRLDIVGIERAVVRKMHQQSAKQRAVGTGPDAQEEIGVCRGVGPARIDHDYARAAPLLVGEHALVQHRMAPRRVRADQHQEVGFVEILITAGHSVGAEGAAMARNR